MGKNKIQKKKTPQNKNKTPKADLWNEATENQGLVLSKFYPSPLLNYEAILKPFIMLLILQECHI